MINVKNTSSATIVLTIPDLRFRRELVPGRSIPLTQEEYDTMMFDPGIAVMIQDHSIVFSGVEDDKQVAVDSSKVYEPATIKKILEELDITKFAKFIPTATASEKETVVKLAVDMGITNSGFTALIKKYCDVDVINAINMKHQAEEK